MAKMGRPPKYKKAFCEQLIDHMSKGLSYESFAATLRVTRDCLYKWEKRHPDFFYAKKVGAELKLLFFEKMGLHGMTGKLKGFNASTYIFTMKNQCGWSDKVETDVSGEININIDGDDSNL